MNILKIGSRGAEVELLQLALNRAGYGILETDGVFGTATKIELQKFQRDRGLTADGILGTKTNMALYPWYTGYRTYTIKKGDSLYNIAQNNYISLRAIETANPKIDPSNLKIGTKIILPLDFPVVATDISYSSSLVHYILLGLAARYPFISDEEYGKSVMGKSLRYLALGTGKNVVMYNATHHANEWITSTILLKFVEDLSSAYMLGEKIYDVSARDLLSEAKIYILPCVNPDGMDLVTGALNSGTYYNRAVEISKNFAWLPFPNGWKANIAGTDPNLQYPANWELAKETKYAQGYTRPAPRDFVGTAPLSAPESRSAYNLTEKIKPNLTLSYHTQGEVIYWKYLDYMPDGAENYVKKFEKASGYLAETTPIASGYAGYKDWYIEKYNKPSYTIEAGRGVSPLPIEDFDRIYGDNIGILVEGMKIL